MDSTYIASTCDEEDTDGMKKNRNELEKRIERIKEEIEMKNVQINEIQSMVIEGDQDDKSKHLFNNILLIESKVLLKHLFSTGVQYLLDSKIKQSTFEASENGSQQEIKEMKKKLESTQEEFDKVKKLHSTELNNLVQHYEQRILLLLKNGIQNSEESILGQKTNSRLTLQKRDRDIAVHDHRRTPLFRDSPFDDFEYPTPLDDKKRDPDYVVDENISTDASPWATPQVPKNSPQVPKKERTSFTEYAKLGNKVTKPKRTSRITRQKSKQLASHFEAANSSSADECIVID